MLDQESKLRSMGSDFASHHARERQGWDHRTKCDFEFGNNLPIYVGKDLSNRVESIR